MSNCTLQSIYYVAVATALKRGLEAKLKAKDKMAGWRFPISNEDERQKLRETAINENTKKSIPTWVNVLRSRAEECVLNSSFKEYSAEQLDKISRDFMLE